MSFKIIPEARKTFIYLHVVDVLQELGLKLSGAHILEGVPFSAPSQPVSSPESHEIKLVILEGERNLL